MIEFMLVTIGILGGLAFIALGVVISVRFPSRVRRSDWTPAGYDSTIVM